MKYFNQKLFHFSQKFANDTEYLFYTQCFAKPKMQEQINVAMRKNSIRALKAEIFNNTSFMEVVRGYDENDQRL